MGKLVDLQVLRGVAASLVVLDHSAETMVRHGYLDERWMQLAWFFGWLGVVVFFLISGFIIIHTLPQPGGTVRSAVTFLSRRLIRVVPLYWVSTGFYYLLKISFGTPPGWEALARSLLFIPYLVPGATDMRPVIGQGWTLNYEMFFYGIVALCLLTSRGTGAVVLFPAMLGLVASHGLTAAPGPYATPQTLAQFWTDPILLFFVAGAAVAHIKRAGVFAAVGRLGFGRPLLVSSVLLLGNVAAFVASGFAFSLPYEAQLMFGVVPVAVLILCTDPFGRVESRAMSLLASAGDASYSTYLFHPLLIGLLVPVFSRLPPGLRHPVGFMVGALLVSTVVGYAIFTLFERPTTVALRRGSLRLLPLRRQARS